MKDESRNPSLPPSPSVFLLHPSSFILPRMADFRIQVALLYHFCRLRLPGLALPLPAFTRRLERAFAGYEKRVAEAGGEPAWGTFLENLHALDWFLACACLEGLSGSFETLFNARANRTEALLVDALRMRAVRLFPRD